MQHMYETRDEHQMTRTTICWRGGNTQRTGRYPFTFWNPAGLRDRSASCNDKTDCCPKSTLDIRSKFVRRGEARRANSTQGPRTSGLRCSGRFGGAARSDRSSYGLLRNASGKGRRKASGGGFSGGGRRYLVTMTALWPIVV